MAVSTPSSNLGRHVFGLATFALHCPRRGHCADRRRRSDPVRSHRKDRRIGPCRSLPRLRLAVPAANRYPPQIYNSWGNFFEQFSLFTGAALVYASLAPVWSPETLNRIGRILLGICVVSFALEQAFISAPRLNLCRSGFRQVRCFGR